MTVYEVTGHPLGPTPDNSVVFPDALRDSLQLVGVDQNVDLTLPAPIITEAQAQDLLA